MVVKILRNYNTRIVFLFSLLCNPILFVACTNRFRILCRNVYNGMQKSVQ
jgi:hypothetical protein